jgi:cellulose synthase/poly-beta-1,6-N-acetylglucosamine synthase-like glycosyltransferase
MMYTYAAAATLLEPPSITRTEDTEGRFRAIKAGLKVRYCSDTKAQFTTMIPQKYGELSRQWARWALGNVQVLREHGIGGGSWWIAIVQLLTWIDTLLVPAGQFFAGQYIDLLPWAREVPLLVDISRLPMGSQIMMFVWMFFVGFIIGVVGAIKLRRYRLMLFGVFVPFMSLYWAWCSLKGLVLAFAKPQPKSTEWVPPVRDVSAIQSQLEAWVMPEPVVAIEATMAVEGAVSA